MPRMLDGYIGALGAMGKALVTRTRVALTGRCSALLYSCGLLQNVKVMTASIHQVVPINASPQRVFEALTDARQFSELTGGARVDMPREAGAAFSCFNGMISGRTIEIVPGRRLVQAWRVGNWPEGVYSIVRFELEPQGNGTVITFDQSGFPEAHREHLESGWHKMYWEPLKTYLGTHQGT